MKDAVGVNVENPGIFIESLSEFADIVVVECINIELHNSYDLVVVIGPCSHGDLPLSVHF